MNSSLLIWPMSLTWALLISCSTPQEQSKILKPAAEQLARISLSDPTPAPGESIRLWAAYGGPYPALIEWTGVTHQEGLTAHFEAKEPGDHTITVSSGSEQLVTIVHVQEAANAGFKPVSGTERILPALRQSCKDRRFPRLVGPFAVGCSPDGLVSRVMDLREPTVVSKLRSPVSSPGWGPGQLFSPERSAGTWILPDPTPIPAPATWTKDLIAPAALLGSNAGLVLRDQISIYELGSRSMTLHDAAPTGWYPPALTQDGIAWVDSRESQLTGLDIWWKPTDGSEEPLVRAPGDQRHVASSGRWIGWIDDDGVWVEDTKTNRRRFYRAETGFRAGLSMWGPVACWEDRSSGDIDIACSDGLMVRREGDQGWPSRWGPWLLYREDGQVKQKTASELIIDDDDQRATLQGKRVAGGFQGAHVEGELSYSLDWPAQNWCIETFEGGEWIPSGPLTVGEVELAGYTDAIRLTPTGPNCSR